MFFNWIKEVDRLLSKGMSNIYLRVTIEMVSEFRFSGFKKLLLGQIWGTPTLADIAEF